MALPSLRDLPRALRATWDESWPAFRLMFWLTFPVVLGLRLIEEFIPLIAIVGGWLYPLMGLMGLPGETGVAWATAILIQPLPAFALIADNWVRLDLTVAQATIFAILVLEVHAIFVEARIAAYLGMRVWVTCVLRFGCALGMGISLDWLYRTAGWLQEPATLLFAGGANVDPGWEAWWLFQAKTWAYFAVFLYGLHLLMRFIKAFHVERLFVIALSPLLRLMGIHRSAATISIIGLVLGLTFGAALMVAESRSGRIPKRDIFLAIGLLGICHSLLEDTLLTFLFGAHVSGVLLFRFVFAAIVIAILSRVLDRLATDWVDRWLMVPIKPA